MIRGLPADEQDAVLALLLQGLTSTEAWQASVLRGEYQRRMAPALLGELQMRPGGQVQPGGQIHLSGGSLAESDAKVVPIRFPAKTHEQLKAWCEEHGFPMAAVVRGLVERFLESQELP
ncbi:MAG: hypothetical protein KGL16_07925 [Acidobacteriota bacterium]|nr:hypothetical protein [Acidobacteriota bacterium]